VICSTEIGEDLYQRLTFFGRKSSIKLAEIEIVDNILHQDLSNFHTTFSNEFGIKEDTIEMICIPLILYKSLKMCEREGDSTIVLIGDSCIGSPYLQSLSNGVLQAFKFYEIFMEDKENLIEKLNSFYQNHSKAIYLRSKILQQNKVEIEKSVKLVKTVLDQYSDFFGDAL